MMLSLSACSNENNEIITAASTTETILFTESFSTTVVLETEALITTAETTPEITTELQNTWVTRTITHATTSIANDYNEGFNYNLPVRTEDIFWSNDYIQKEIDYIFYPVDENITKYVPSEIVDVMAERSAVLGEHYTYEAKMTCIGVMEFDMNDDGVSDFLIQAQTSPYEYDFEYGKPQSKDEDSVVFITEENGYKLIERMSYSGYYNFTYKPADDPDENDGYILSTKTNGMYDLFIRLFDGYTYNYDGDSDYINMDGSDIFDKYFVGKDEINGLARVILDRTVGWDAKYYMVIKLSEDSPVKQKVLYTCDEFGNLVIYDVFSEEVFSEDLPNFSQFAFFGEFLPGGNPDDITVLEVKIIIVDDKSGV
jgi:hypothetical protein